MGIAADPNSSPGDLVAHFEKRLDTLEGKAMIVAMSRRICVELFEDSEAPSGLVRRR